MLERVFLLCTTCPVMDETIFIRDLDQIDFGTEESMFGGENYLIIYDCPACGKDIHRILAKEWDKQ